MPNQPPRRLIKTLLFTILVSIALIGCGSDSSPTNPSAEGQPETGAIALGIRLSEDGAGKTAWPPPSIAGIAELHLSFESVVAYRVSDTLVGGHHGIVEAEPVEILIEPVTVEVMELENTLTAFLAEAQLPEGHYTKIELGLAAVWAVTTTGSVIPVALPARGDSLLRVIAPFDVTNEEATALVLVIDLGRSLHEFPRGSGEYVLRPVIRSEIAPHEGIHEWHGEHMSDDDHGMGHGDMHGDHMGEGDMGNGHGGHGGMMDGDGNRGDTVRGR
ncbi:MAG: DUF4382 domain-containing protein [Acidimicrobiia bacterium]|nr:DUF4382 domain-containing protein [Acidimicrobiia bacterium]